jgi:predicted dehydrogenase
MKFIIKPVFLLSLLLTVSAGIQAQELSEKPIRLAVSGLTHAHVSFILGRKDKPDMRLVGVYEPNRALALRLAKAYHFDTALIYDNLDKMLDAVKPEAVAAFGSIYEHLAVVESCAPRGIHVMVEKPLATTPEHARKMQQLAQKYQIHLLTDYETSWYPSNAKSNQLVNDSNFVGNIRKVVFHDGHQGPKEIGCNQEFLDWLTDPVQNGGGALMDFGCYGANLMTFLKKGETPLSVSAVVRHYKPAVYPKVEDDAVILVNYPESQCVIQASWNWPFNRKDMEIYGETGYIVSENNNDMRLRNRSMKGEERRHVTSKDIAVYEEPFSYFFDVIRGKVKQNPYDLYALENNLMVVKILDAARKSAETGKTFYFK